MPNFDEDLVIRATARLVGQFDAENGGFGGAPKFPQAPVLEFLLRAHRLIGDEGSLGMSVATLEAMAEGGLFDQIGGGFHRYAVDDIWLVPHFEKMLYDNAQLARLYTDAWRTSHNPAFKRIAELTLDYLVREMTAPEAAFYSAQDADSEGIEGKFYVWNPDQIRAVLSVDDADLASTAFGITEDGNFEGESIPTAPSDPSDPEIERIRLVLLAARANRVAPATDTKIITAWNGMTIRALAEASLAFARPDYASAAVGCATFLRDRLWADGVLFRTWDGVAPKIPGFLEDYAHLIDGLMALYEATFDLIWLDWAIDLATRLLVEFSDDDGVTLYDTSARHDTFLFRPRDLQDGATPCGNSVARQVLIRMGHLTGNDAWIETGLTGIAVMNSPMESQPLGFGRFLSAATMTLAPIREIAIAVPAESKPATEFVGAVYQRFEPNALVALATGDAATRMPWLSDRPVRKDLPTAYLCEQFVCLPPVTEAADLTKLLEMGTGMVWTSF